MGAPNSELLDKQPPCDLEAERAVLGSVLIDPDLADSLTVELEASDFYAKANSILYGAIVGLVSEGTKADLVTLADWLKRHGQLEDVGGRAHLAEVAQSVPVSAHFQYYAKIVRRTAAQRFAIHELVATLKRAYDYGEDPMALCRYLRRRVDNMRAWLKQRGVR